MKFEKRGASADVATDIEHAKMRMIYENSADYAAWRQRVGLAKPLEPRGDPVMRHRVAKLFRGLGVSL